MVAAPMMSRPCDYQQDNNTPRAPVSPAPELSKTELPTVPTVNEKRTDPTLREDDANRSDIDSPHGGLGADEVVGRESGDLFGESRALGKRLQKSGQYKQALEQYRVALRCKNTTLASEPKEVQATFGDILYDIGSIHWYSEDGNPEQSLEAFHFCLQVRRTCFGPAHPAVARVLYKLASLHSSAGDNEYALQLLLEALSIFLHATPSDHSILNNVWTAIGNIQQALGHMDEAKSAFQEAAHIQLK